MLRVEKIIMINYKRCFNNYYVSLNVKVFLNSFNGFCVIK